MGSIFIDEKIDGKNVAHIAANTEAHRVAESDGKSQSFQANIVLDNPEGMILSKGWQLNASGAAQLAADTSVDFHAKAQQIRGQGTGASFARAMFGGATESNSARADFGANLNYRQGKGRAVARLSGSVGKDGLDVKIDGEGKRLVEFVDDIRVRNCVLTERPFGPAGAKYVVDCPVRGAVPLPPKEYSIIQLPTRIGLRLSGEVQLLDSDSIRGKPARGQYGGGARSGDFPSFHGRR